MSVKDADSWDGVFTMNDEVKDELLFWERVFKGGHLHWPIKREKPPENCLELFTDASSVGGGGY